MGKDIVYVRFTSIEFEKVLNLSKGSTFTHVNLFHSKTKFGIDSNEYQYGVRILVGGKNTKDACIEPIINTSDRIKLRLLDITSPIQIEPPNFPAENVLLHNKNGVYESLWDRYSTVMDLTMEEFSYMKYYARLFEKV